MNDNDPYSYPGTDVLRNKASIRDAEKLTQYEYRKTAERSLELQESPIKGTFDLKHLQAIHKHLFQDVYEWAGELRTVTISKGSSQFARPDMIESYANSTVFKDLAKDKHLVGMEKEQFSDRLAHHYAEINALHPFREGNGRSTRQFVEQLAIHAGYEIDYSKVDQKRWNEAARDSFNGRLEPMRQVFSDVARPAKAVAFERDTPEDAVKKHPDLINAYAAIKAAELVAKDKFKTTDDQQRFVGMVKESLAQRIEQNKPIPEVTIKDRQHGTEHEPPTANQLER